MISVSIFRFLQYIQASAGYRYKLTRLLNINSRELDLLYKEIDKSELVRGLVQQKGIRRGFFDFSMLSVLRAPTIYVVCRVLKPDIMVETGVAEGFSSSFILQALEMNKKGQLYSIDLPNQIGQELPKSKMTGWLVPEEFKKRWSLVIGSSKEKLPTLLQSLKEIDVFYHDSDHSYENMLFEFNLAWDYIRRNGILLSDDITDNDSFSDFYLHKHCHAARLFKLGIIKKD